MNTNEGLAYELLRFNAYMLTFARSHLGDILNVNGKANQGSLTMQQLNFLFQIESCGKITVSDLAKALTLSKSSTSLSIGQMVNKGYLQRETCNNDGRYVYISLTETGTALLNETKNKMMEKTSAILSLEDSSKQKELYHHLQAINQIIFTGGQTK
ncbi:MarR family winged helix-turn-helix transcriptional regulator [Chakrabartyella piscis]|uniref:MarR family winged helix-turn-helix transcriptional regulator n=1 Tax=Chakrabartyella piscis TaxID=2918914 RepID=UPI002958C291|nr:MarR family transcriptional regulator [Chakrabartyella piscis]